VPLHAEVIRSPRVRRLVLPKVTHSTWTLCRGIRLTSQLSPAQTFRRIHGTCHTSKMPSATPVTCAHSPRVQAMSYFMAYGRCPGNLLRSDSVVHPHGSIASRLRAHEARACHKHCPTPDLSPTLRYFDRKTTPVHSFWTSAHISTLFASLFEAQILFIAIYVTTYRSEHSQRRLIPRVQATWIISLPSTRY
jgi:hypothetical protein